MTTRDASHSSSSHSSSGRSSSHSPSTVAKPAPPAPAQAPIPKPKESAAAAPTYSYKNEQVTIVRPATLADMGYTQNGGPQVLVHFEDGHEEVAIKSAVV
jgi:hypothetical protein